MISPDADVRAMRRDVLWLLGVPAILVAGLAYITWPWTTPEYAAPTQEAFFATAAGVWDWESDSSCIADPEVITFSTTRDLMVITMRKPWATDGGDSVRAAVYDLSDRSRSRVRGAIRHEARKTPDGLPVKWDLVLQGPNRFAWHRTDWDSTATTASLHRCPAGADSLVPHLSAAERLALGLDSL
jgi:hypothetical protein